MIEHAYLIPLIPLAASLLVLFGGKEDPHSPMPWVAIGAMAVCLGLSWTIFQGAASGALALPYERNWEWFSFATTLGGKSFIYAMPVGVLIDAPAAVLLVVVSLVSLMVQVYSVSYMHGDPRYKRYFAFVSFFTAAMLGLVVSSNLLVTFACWELMGLCSYLLIGFWFERPGPCEAQKKAFMTTKLGDSGLYVALLLLYAKTGSFQLSQIRLFFEHGYMPAAVATAAALGLLLGAAGKSAQAPLFIWLPDAMEGPTPGSALIHAATMVAAGILLVAKTYFVFLASPVAMEAAAWLGLLTAFLAAAMALVSYDIKRVLAFSTISQLGFMMCALGVGGFTAGLFHLTTHAFFKALLFLGAGSIIHAVHTNDMRLMGGLSKKMPVTFLTMLAAVLAIAGVPGFSGYYSKDMILGAVWEHNRLMFGLLAFTALMTAFYMFRLFFLTFWGEGRDHDRHHHAHESPGLITAPLLVLALLAVFSGFGLSRGHLVERLLPKPVAAHPAAETAQAAPRPEQSAAPEAARAHPADHAHPIHHQEAEMPAPLASAVVALVLGAIGLAFLLYRGPTYPIADLLKSRLRPAFALLDRRWYLDDVFLALAALSDRVAALAFWIDANVIDRVFVDGWGLLTRVFAEIGNALDVHLVDSAVDGVGGLAADLGAGLRALVVDGQVQVYLAYAAVFGLAAAMLLML
ncbi:MAG: NADH-quinone oxidoreductase subunit L [Elusimicrobia bacterium]|nr:NADH-quinone oxidoreductase subunit L [Elusimicrobiota bacterium]